MLIVKNLIKRFNLEVSNEEFADLNRVINGSAIHRLGLELVNAVKITDGNKNVVGWGTKENSYLTSLAPEERVISLKRVLSIDTPLVLLSMGVSEEISNLIEDVCNEYNIPLVKSKLHLSYVSMTIGLYIVKFLAESTTIHGSLVVVNGIGVMIIGKSGIGKSEAVLELIQKGSSFVCDDSVVVKRIGTDFIGEPAKLTKDFLEARGIGLIDIPKIYGFKSTSDFANIDLVIELLPSEDLNKVDRLGNMGLKYEVLGGEIDKVQIPVENGRTLSALIEAATNVYIAKIHGHNPLEIISERNK